MYPCVHIPAASMHMAHAGGIIKSLVDGMEKNHCMHSSLTLQLYMSTRERKRIIAFVNFDRRLIL